MKIIPHLEFNKYDLALGVIIRRENESKKYIIVWLTDIDI